MPHGSDPLMSLPEICAPREDLLRVFDERSKKQFIYVQAPAGYGKTISALLWLKKTQRAFSWLFLDIYDNMLSLFYRSLCSSLLTAYQSSRTGIAERRPPLSDDDDVLPRYLNNAAFSASPVESALEFIAMLPWSEEQFTLVLDDLHNITNEEILKSLPYVLKRLPQHVNVLLLSRVALPDEMRVMTDNAKTGFVGMDELSFTPEEIRSHFISYGWFISAERATDIHEFTDGWVIILNAIILSGTHKLSYISHKPTLEDFFEYNIWSGFDETTRAFLMKTSIVDSFTIELCELLTNDPDSAETLDMLIRGNINLSRMGYEYRYHNLFLEFLRERLKKSDIRTESLFSSAANYYLDSGQFYKAAICSMRQNDPQLKMQVVQTFFQSKDPALEQFLELSQVYGTSRLPEEAYVRSPILYMPVILDAFLKGETVKMEEMFDKFYTTLPAFIKTNNPLADTVSTRLLFDYRRDLAGLVAFMGASGIPYDKMIPGHAAVVTIQMPMLHRSVRDFHEFLDGGVKDAVYDVFSSILPGDCDCFFSGVSAGLLMEQNRLGEALEEALGAYNLTTNETSNEIYFGLSTLLAELYSLTSEKDRAQSILQRLHGWIDDNKALHLLKNLEAYEKRLRIWDSDEGAAREWLDNYFVNDSSFGEFYKIYQNFTTVRAYIVTSRIGDAESALKKIRKLAGDMNRPLDSAEAEVLLSVIEWVSGKKREARDRLLSVLADMQPHGFIRVVANEGKSVLPVLAAAVKKLDNESGDIESLYRFAKEVQVAAYEQSKRFRGLTSNLQLKPIKLSPKQTLVLELLSKGHKNAEIVEITGLSINTIREHTRVAYRKLEVTNVMDAIIKAKQLGLLR